jgi:hypothetical protein
MNFSQIKEKLFAGQAGNKNKKMIILMPVLILVFVFVLTRAFKQPSPASASSVSFTQKAIDVAKAANSKLKVNWKIPDLIPATLRDPMKACSSSASKQAPDNILIKGILYSNDRPAVLIDNKIFHKGDKVGASTIVKINKKDVEFESNGKTWTQQVQQ